MKDSNVKSCDFLVIKPTGKYDFISEREHTQTDLFEISSCNTKYAVLEKEQKTINTSKSEQQYKKQQLYIQDMLLSKITLVNVPTSTYILQICNENAITAKKIKEDYVFDIGESEGKFLTTLKCVSHGDNEESFTEKKKKYLRTGKLDNIFLFSTKAIDKNYEITYEGWVYDAENKTWIDKKINYTLFSDEVRLTMNHPTRQVVFESTTEKNFKISLRIANEVYGPFTTNENYLKIYFEGFDFANGPQNKYLSEGKNKNTINFSRIHDVSFTTNVKSISVSQYKYVIRDVQTCDVLFL